MLRYNNMKKENITSSPGQTKKLALELIRKIIKKGPQTRAFVIALKGDLGGGKTIFIQGLAKALGVKQKILSPTFNIFKKFQIPNSKFQTNSKSQNSKFKTFYHFDCYRIKKPKEILDLGFKKIISNPKNILAIEWAEKIKKILPKNTLWINFKFINKNSRLLTFAIINKIIPF